MTEFIAIYWKDITLVIGVVALSIFAIARGYRKEVANLAYQLVCKAENEIKGNKMGMERKKQVIKWLHEQLPVVVKFLVSEEELSEYIEDAVLRMKLMLESASKEDSV